MCPRRRCACCAMRQLESPPLHPLTGCPSRTHALHKVRCTLSVANTMRTRRLSFTRTLSLSPDVAPSAACTDRPHVTRILHLTRPGLHLACRQPNPPPRLQPTRDVPLNVSRRRVTQPTSLTRTGLWTCFAACNLRPLSVSPACHVSAFQLVPTTRPASVSGPVLILPRVA